MKLNTAITLPAEWYPQSAVQLTWPHEDTDWFPILEEVIPCFVAIAKEIVKREKLIIVCRDIETVKEQIGKTDYSRVIFRTIPSNDTWARDHGPISVLKRKKPYIYDFQFNGWGLKYAANFDNMITTGLYSELVFPAYVKYENCLDFILEGGSIESDGKGTLLTTEYCLCAPNRNEKLYFEEIENRLKRMFGLRRILWLSYGRLAGDDTDGHIDTLARFCNEETIAYVSCRDKMDEHYRELKLMEKELEDFRTLEGKPYRLVPLPMAEKVEWNGERLPATYANFLIINGAVLVPFYNSPRDEEAKEILQQVFPDREIIGINCLPLIKQHGSLHCVTMQYPEGFVL
ncbi:agmatine deiminase family protein [Parabacteroides pacaensis]|uniref:agmatine deiminase family protein n=1 Tax=Parabacteroides pacaensis TaxID=2086575 RepID=UPI000D0F19CC|nr:agmatine deiminase family protein [Parabacteroides pacaensis]